MWRGIVQTTGGFSNLKGHRIHQGISFQFGFWDELRCNSTPGFSSQPWLLIPTFCWHRWRSLSPCNSPSISVSSMHSYYLDHILFLIHLNRVYLRPASRWCWWERTVDSSWASDVTGQREQVLRAACYPVGTRVGLPLTDLAQRKCLRQCDCTRRSATTPLHGLAEVVSCEMQSKM